MNLLALDPASEVTGFAEMWWRTAPDGSVDLHAEPRLLSAGLIKVTAAKRGLVGRIHQVELSWLMRFGLESSRRIAALGCDIRDLLEDRKPCCVVIEVPSGKAGTGSKNGARSSLATYGHAAGAVRAWAGVTGAHVLPVDERTWTSDAGTSKDGRSSSAATLYPGQYDSTKDTDTYDMADAIMLGRWALKQLATHHFTKDLSECRILNAT